MSSSGNVQPDGEKLRRAVCWMSDTIKTYPEKKRESILRDAQTRFDLSPKECEFLNKEFC